MSLLYGNGSRRKSDEKEKKFVKAPPFYFPFFRIIQLSSSSPEFLVQKKRSEREKRALEALHNGTLWNYFVVAESERYFQRVRDMFFQNEL